MKVGSPAGCAGEFQSTPLHSLLFKYLKTKICKNCASKCEIAKLCFLNSVFVACTYDCSCIAEFLSCVRSIAVINLAVCL